MKTNVELVEQLKNDEKENKLSIADFVWEYEFSSEFYWVEERGRNELEEMVKDFFESYDVQDEDLAKYAEEGNDFWNDKTKEGYYWCDISSEWADSQVDIYYADMYKSVWDYSDRVEERLEEV